MNHPWHRRPWLSLILVGATLADLVAPCAAQTTPAPACTAAADLVSSQLYGVWQAEVEGQPQPATMTLQANQDYADSVQGTLVRLLDGKTLTSQVAGDVDHGVFTLDQSDDGQHINATWVGDVTPNRCDQEIRGIWTDSQLHQPHAFVLHRAN